MSESAREALGGGRKCTNRDIIDASFRDTPDLQEAPQLSGSRPDIRDTDSIVAVASTERLMESWVLRCRHQSWMGKTSTLYISHSNSS